MPKNVGSALFDWNNSHWSRTLLQFFFVKKHFLRKKTAASLGDSQRHGVKSFVYKQGMLLPFDRCGGLGVVIEDATRNAMRARCYCPDFFFDIPRQVVGISCHEID